MLNHQKNFKTQKYWLHRGFFYFMIIMIVGSLISFSELSAQKLTLARFFGACEDAGTDTKKSVGEACIIQSIINSASKEISGVTVETLPTDWGNYYDQLKATYAAKSPPDIHVMHRHRVPEFAGIGAVAELSKGDLRKAGIDINDWLPRALDAVSYKGKIYGIPMDFHANLWHVNMEIMKKAGLVKNGKPILPRNANEMLKHAKMVKEKTGKDYLAADFAQFPIGVRLVLAFLWQQNSNIFKDNKVTLNTSQGKRAVEVITQLFDNGYADPKLNYADSQQSFLNGETAILVNGTWVVDFYTAEAKKKEVALNSYYVANFPTLFKSGATWADTHMWAIPASLKKDNKRFQAALKVLAFINDHNVDWARTGHMTVKKSVLNSRVYKNMPHRSEYSQTADLAKDTPPSKHYGAIQDVLNRELQAIWLSDKNIDDALSDAELDIEDILE